MLKFSHNPYSITEDSETALSRFRDLCAWRKVQHLDSKMMNNVLLILFSECIIIKTVCYSYMFCF